VSGTSWPRTLAKPLSTYIFSSISALKWSKSTNAISGFISAVFDYSFTAAVCHVYGANGVVHFTCFAMLVDKTTVTAVARLTSNEARTR